MAELSITYSLVTPGPDITFSDTGTGDEYRLTDILGLDQAPLRAPVDDSPQTDGGIVHDIFKGPRHIVFTGLLLCRTGTSAARNTMEDNLISALDSILLANGTLSFTRSGGTSRTLTVRCDVPVVYATWSGFPNTKTFIFGLVAANPAFS